MTNDLPISAMRQGSASLTAETIRTEEPNHLTRYGKAAVAVMDATELDLHMAHDDVLAAREERVHEGIMRGHREIEAGEGVPLDEALVHLGPPWGR